MFTAQKAYYLLVKHGVIGSNQLVVPQDLNGGELTLRSLTEPQNQEIQSFLGCDLLASETANNSIDFNHYTYGNFLYQHSEGDETPYSVLAQVVIHTPKQGRFSQASLHYFDENALRNKGKAFTQVEILNILVSCSFDRIETGFFIKSPYRINLDDMSVDHERIAEEKRTHFSNEELLDSKTTGDLDGYRFYVIPNVVMIEIEKLEYIPTEKSDVLADSLGIYYSNTATNLEQTG